jgi:hypothetical protein
MLTFIYTLEYRGVIPIEQRLYYAIGTAPSTAYSNAVGSTYAYLNYPGNVG